MPSVIPAVARDVFERIAAAYQSDHPAHPLTSSQIDLARILALSEQPVETVVSVPGTGRTVLVEVLARAVRASGGRLIGLGLSTLSASYLVQDLNGVPAYTVVHWLRGRRQARSSGSNAEFVLGPRDVLFLHDAEVLTAGQREQLLHDAAGHGALVRFTTSS